MTLISGCGSDRGNGHRRIIYRVLDLGLQLNAVAKPGKTCTIYAATTCVTICNTCDLLRSVTAKPSVEHWRDSSLSVAGIVRGCDKSWGGDLRVEWRNHERTIDSPHYSTHPAVSSTLSAALLSVRRPLGTITHAVWCCNVEQLHLGWVA